MSFKILFFFLFISISSEFRAQKEFNSSPKSDFSRYEKYFLQQDRFGKDTLAVKLFLKPLVESDLNEDKIIADILLANSYALAFDRVNIKSDTYYSRSLSKAKQSSNTALEIFATLNYAQYYYTYREMTKALPYFLSTISKIEEINPSNLLLPADTFTKIGFYMGTIGDYSEAINYLKKALQFTHPNSSEFAKICDNLGIYYLETGDLENAYKNIIKASEAAKLNGDQVRFAKTLGNLALIFEKKQDYKKAIKLVLEDIKISEENGSTKNTMFAYTVLTRLYISNKEFEKAKITVKKADDIAKTKSYFKINELEILKLKLELIDKSGREEEELQVRRRIAILEDSLQKTDGFIPLNQAKWLMQKRKYQQSIAIADKKISRESFWKNLIFSLAGLFMVIVSIFIIVNKLREKKKKKLVEAQFLEYEKTKLRNEKKLLDANKTVDSQVSFLEEKNIHIEKLHAEIENFKKSRLFSQNEEHGKLDDLLQSHLMTDENWRIFRGEFQREYPLFYNNLQQDFPELTSSNLRIILLQKLGFSNAEISGFLGITVDAVKKSKQRLKRKLGDKYDQLFEMIFSQN